MSTLPTDRLAALLAPFYPEPSPLLLDQLSRYLDLLIKWNSRTNLTAIREPEEIVKRHFGESLFAARHLPRTSTLLDLGSGAGFPGLPIQLAHPELQVTLAESQTKKAGFLQEVVRSLNVRTEVWAKRVEEMEATRRFDLVTIRAVDDPALAFRLARDHTAPGSTIVHFTVKNDSEGDVLSIPGSSQRVLRFVSV